MEAFRKKISSIACMNFVCLLLFIMVYCCVPFCKSDSKNSKQLSVSFHQFPVDEELCNLWLKNISRDDFVINQNSSSSVVCSRHFKPEDYIQGLKVRRLKNGAIPSVFEGYPSYKVPKPAKPRPTTTKRKLNDLPKNVGKRICLGQETSSEFSSVSDAELLLNFANSNFLRENDVVSPSNFGQTCAQQSENVSTSGVKPRRQYQLLSKLRKKSKNLNSLVWKKSLKIQKLDKEIEALKKKISYYESNKYHKSLEKIIVMEDANVGSKSGRFLLSQLENFFKQRPTWSDEILRECCLWTKGYNFARDRKLFKLPCRSTLAKYLGPVSGDVGVTPLIAERLQQEHSKLNDFERLCSMAIDEMAIKPSSHYDKALDTIFGDAELFDDAPTSNSPLANRLLCFILRGLSTNYVIPCGYFFTKQLKGSQLHSLTMNVFSSVENIGFRVLRIVTDNHKVNAMLFKILGGGTIFPEIPHPLEPSGRPLFLSYDPNHIIKNVRSLFLEKDMSDGTQKISGQYVKSLYYLQKNENIKAVRNLTHRHVEPSNIDKMNVGRAVLIFSPPVTAALEFLKQNSSRHHSAEKFKDADATITFLKNFYKWFSIHDVSSTVKGQMSLDPSKFHFFSCNDERLHWLTDSFLPYLENLKRQCDLLDFPFLSKETYAAIITTTKATVGCTKYLLSSGYHYVLTRRFNSDPIESLFSAIRQMNGGNDMMDVKSTIVSLEKILKTGIIFASKYANVKGQDTLLSKDALKTKPVNFSVELSRNSLPEDALLMLDSISEAQSLPRTDLASACLALVAGYLVFTFSEITDCASCLEAISSTKCDAPILALIANQDRGGLHYPKPKFVSLLEKIKAFIERALPHLPRKYIKKSLTFFLLPQLELCPDLKVCNPEHSKNLCSFICKQFLPLLLKNVCKEKSDKVKFNMFYREKPLNRKFYKLS